MTEKHSTSIRLQDLELLRNLCAIEGRDGTVILHRALIDYTTAAEDDAKVMGDKTKAGALRAAIERALVGSSTPQTEPLHDRIVGRYGKGKTRRRN